MNARLLTVAILFLPFAAGVSAQERQLALDSPAGLTLHNAQAESVSFQGRRALKLTAKPGPGPAGPSATKRAPGKTGTKGRAGPAAGEASRQDHLALIEGMEFSNGTIEVDIAGSPSPDASGGARGFVGVAFRVQPDRRTYDCFYLRPTNGRADDQERRNHTAQYISHPEHTWYVLREKSPSRYESYVDIGPDEWFHVKIEVNGDKARLYVNGSTQPTLVVNDVKTGATAKGGVALWFEGSTIAHFANLKVTPR